MSRTPPGYFERLYDSDEDPWGFETSWYERRKYAVTMASLPDETYRSAFEPGCSVGVLTESLARRCDAVLAVDLMAVAVEAAKRRLAPFPHVEVRRATIPEEWPTGPFDLLVLSEVCYYFDEEELGRLVERAMASLSHGATVIAVHWRGETDYPLTAEATHAAIGLAPGLTPGAHHEDDDFLLDVWRLHRPA